MAEKRRYYHPETLVISYEHPEAAAVMGLEPWDGPEHEIDCDKVTLVCRPIFPGQENDHLLNEDAPTVKELREQARKAGVSTTGTKEELARRVHEATADPAAPATEPEVGKTNQDEDPAVAEEPSTGDPQKNDPQKEGQ